MANIDVLLIHQCHVAIITKNTIGDSTIMTVEKQSLLVEWGELIGQHGANSIK